jgi:hypothetical protein
MINTPVPVMQAIALLKVITSSRQIIKLTASGPAPCHWIKYLNRIMQIAVHRTIEGRVHRCSTGLEGAIVRLKRDMDRRIQSKT